MERDEKKILKEFTKWVDDQMTFDQWIRGIGGKIAESIDGALFGYVIKIGYENLPDDYKDEALIVMQGVTSGDLDTIADGVIESFVKNVKTPLSDEKEAIILGGLWDIIAKLIALKK
jgi:hypothetical protein